MLAVVHARGRVGRLLEEIQAPAALARHISAALERNGERIEQRLLPA